MKEIPESELFPREHRLIELLRQNATKQVPAGISPDWPYWENMGDVTIMDAVYLSLGLEPRERVADLNFEYLSYSLDKRVSDLTERTRMHTSLKMLEKVRDLTTERIAQALSHIAVGKLPHRIANPGSAALAPLLGVQVRYMVELRPFRAWGESLPVPYIFPEQFPRLAGSPTTPALYGGGATCVDAEYDEQVKEALSPAPSDNEPDTKTRKTYLRTIRALANFDKLIDENGQVATGAAGKISRRLRALHFKGPTERTLRDLLNEAASLEPDAD